MALKMTRSRSEFVLSAVEPELCKEEELRRKFCRQTLTQDSCVAGKLRQVHPLYSHLCPEWPSKEPAWISWTSANLKKTFQVTTGAATESCTLPMRYLSWLQSCYCHAPHMPFMIKIWEVGSQGNWWQNHKSQCALCICFNDLWRTRRILSQFGVPSQYRL